MSAEIERVFSNYVLALGNERHRLDPETLEKQILLRSWLRNSIRKQDQEVSSFFYYNCFINYLQITFLPIATEDEGDGEAEVTEIEG